MSNLIKTELYKLRTSKLFIILLCVCTVINAVMAAVGQVLVEVISHKSEPSMLSGVISSSFSLDFLMLFVFISAVSFLYLDFSGGYIKNIAGQLPSRDSIVLSKFIIIAVHNLVFFVAGVLSYTLGTIVVGGLVVDAENIAAGFLTMLIKWLLSLALCSILMFFAVGLRNKTIATIFGVIFPIGALSLIYMGINSLVSTLIKGSEFKLGDYMPDTLISSVNAVNNELVINAVIVAIVYIVLFYILTLITFKKRDIK